MRVRSIRNIAESDTIKDRSSIANATSAPLSTVLTETEAAQFIGMSPAWLKKSRTKRFRGVMDAPPFIRAGVKRVVYRIEDLEAWQDRHLEHVGPTQSVGPDNIATTPVCGEATASKVPSIRARRFDEEASCFAECSGVER